MTDLVKKMNPQHFGSDSADIRIWIQINPAPPIRCLCVDFVRITNCFYDYDYDNPETGIRIPDYCRLTLGTLAEVCTLCEHILCLISSPSGEYDSRNNHV